MGRKRIDLTGKTFGKWTVLSMCERTENEPTMCECRCECGNIRKVQATSLINGRSRGCRQCQVNREKTKAWNRIINYHKEQEGMLNSAIDCVTDPHRKVTSHEVCILRKNLSK